MLSAQFFDGFGGRFHGVLLGVYILHIGGLAGFAGFAAIGTLGGVLAPVVAATVTSRFGGRAMMRGAALTLMGARIGSYLAVLVVPGVWALFSLRLIGAVCGMLLVNGAKGQVPEGRNASTSLAWLNVTNGAGQVTATVAAALLASASETTIALIATPVVVTATVPMLRLARFAPTQQTRLRGQLAALRGAARPAVTGTVLISLAAAPVILADGITAQAYGVGWLGPLAAVGFAGGFAAASLLPLLNRADLHPQHDPLLWAALGAAGLSLWAFSGIGPIWLLGGRFLAGTFSGIVGFRVEARILEAVPREQAVSALAAAAGLTSLAGATATWLVPTVLSVTSMRTFTLLCMLALSTAGAAWTIASQYRMRHPAPVTA